MVIFCKCSVCQVMHLAPYGSSCKYAAEARQYCVDNRLPEKDFSQYIDLEGMPKPGIDDDIEQDSKEQDPKDSSDITLAMVQDLVRINRDQAKQMDLLISKMLTLTMGLRSVRIGRTESAIDSSTARGPWNHGACRACVVLVLCSTTSSHI